MRSGLARREVDMNGSDVGHSNVYVHILADIPLDKRERRWVE